MKTRTYLLALLGAASLSVCQAQNKITLQHNGQFTYYDQDSLQVALDDAQDGDVVLLPGGTYSGNVTVKSRVSLFGVGINPDSATATGTTVLSSIIHLTNDASGSYFSGLRVIGSIDGAFGTALDDDVDDIFIHRCHLGGINTNYIIASGADNWLITECITGNIYPNRGWVISNSIVDGYIQSSTNTQIEQCVFLASPGGGGAGSTIANCSSCTIRGNIFANALARVRGNSSSWATCSDNVFVDPAPLIQSASDYQNSKGVSQAQLFAGYAGETTYNFTIDLHLIPSSPAAEAGPGNSDCGIYGGASPWKEGSLPLPPHILERAVGTSTTPTGDLPVQVKVAAQDH